MSRTSGFTEHRALRMISCAAALRLRDSMVVVAAEKLHFRIEAQRRKIDDFNSFGRLLSFRQRPAIEEDHIKISGQAARYCKRANEMPHAQRVLAIEKKSWAKVIRIYSLDYGNQILLKLNRSGGQCGGGLSKPADDTVADDIGEVCMVEQVKSVECSTPFF